MRSLVQLGVIGAKLLRAVVALALLVAVVIGIPWFLSSSLGWPWPRPLPTSFGAVEPWLAVWRINRGRFMLDLLGIVGWVYWGAFVRQLVVQLPGAIADAAAVTRNRVPSGTIRRAGPAASIVGLLLASLVLSLASARTSSAAAANARLTPVKHAVSTTTPSMGSRSYTVREGDDLWDIAAKETGDPTRWTEIYEENRGRLQPDGTELRDPDLIQPGWKLALPDTVPPPSAPAAPVSPTTHDQPQSSQQVHAAPTTRPAVAQRDRAGVHLPDGGYVGVGLASAFAASVALARIVRRSRTTARWPIPTANASHPAPRSAAVAAVERAHLAMLAPPCLGYVQQGDLANDDSPDPYLAALESERPAGSEVRPVAPRSGLSGPTIPASLRSLEIASGLVLGTDEDQVAVPLDLRTTAGIGLTGAGTDNVARAVLVGVVTNGGPLANLDQMRAIVPASDFAGLVGRDLSALPRLDLPTDLDAAIDLLEAEYLRRRQVLTDREVRDSAELRRFYPDRSFEPIVLIARLEAPAAPRLAALLDVGRTTDLHAVLLGSWESGVSVEVDASGRTTCSDVRYDDIDAFRLDIAEASALLRELADPLAEPEMVAEPPSVPEPRPAAEPVTRPTATPPSSNPRVQINILGPVTITVDGREVTTYNKVRTVLAYLALNSSGASSERLLEDIWISDTGEVTGKPATVRATIYNARTELRNASAEPDRSFVDNRNGRYILLPDEVGTDIATFHSHLGTANRATTEADQISALQSAIDCYRDQLARDLHADWLIVEREAESRRFGDACCRLSALTTDSHPELALQVLERALADAPFNQELYAKIMRVQARLGRYSELTKTVRLLELRMAALDDEPDETIYRLLDQLMGEQAPQR